MISGIISRLTYAFRKGSLPPAPPAPPVLEA
jgi:hypothetical protein